MEPLEQRTLLAALDVVPLASPVHGDIDYYRFGVGDSGRITIDVSGGDLDSRLALYTYTDDFERIIAGGIDPREWLLAESDDRSSEDVNPLLDFHHTADGRQDYVLAVAASDGSATGDYELDVWFDPAAEPYERIEDIEIPTSITAGDFNGDALTDMAITHQNGYVSVMLGLGDGTFQQVLNRLGEQYRVAVGKSPESAVAGYFDADKYLDLAVGNRYSGSVSILLGRGDGTFREGQADDAIDVDVGPRAIAASDLNGDGYTDLAVANSGSNSVSLLFGRGDGAFDVEPQSLEAGDSPRGVVAEDFDRDGNIDLATANRKSHDVIVWLGDGKGDFTRQEPIGDIENAFSLVAGDFDDDSWLDLAVVSDKGFVSILLGGESGFTDEARIKVGLDSERIVAGDVDRDGCLDLIAANETLAGKLYVLLGRGDGTFQDPMQVVVGSNAQTFIAAHLNDDNGDGAFDERDVLDLAVPNRQSNNVSVLIGRGDGTFYDERNTTELDAGSIVKADFNEDGRLDVATANRVSDSISILLGMGNNTFESEVPLKVGDGPWDLVAADLDNDDNIDLATANRYSNSITVLWGNGAGYFTPREYRSVGEGPSALIVSDLDGDGFLDLATANSYSKKTPITILWGLGKRDFLLEQVHSSSISGRYPSAIVGIDLDRDGHIDLATENALTGGYSVLFGQGDRKFAPAQPFDDGQDPFDVVGLLSSQQTLPDGAGRFNPESVLPTYLNEDEIVDLVIANPLANEISVRLGKGNGDFGPEIRRATEVVDGDPRIAVAGHFDDDDHMDLAISHESKGNVSVLLGRGDGHFDTASPVTVDVGKSPSHLVTGYFNDDDRLDLAVANSGANSVSILLGRGDGSFDTTSVDDVGAGPSGLVAGYFDEDQDLDLAVVNKDTNEVSILLGDGFGGFKKNGRVGVGKTPMWIVADDFNHDGRLDLATANQGDDTVSILLGNGHGTFQRLEDDVGAGELPQSLTVGDFTGDDLPDLAVANRLSSHLTVLEGSGDGKFTLLGTEDVGLNPWFVAADDFDGDGLMDLVSSNKQSNNVTVLLNKGLDDDEGGLAVERTDLGLADAPEAWVEGDFDSDGEGETVTATRMNEITIDDEIGVADQLAIGPIVEDVDGNGLPDVLTVDSAGEILIRRGQLDAMGELVFAYPQIVTDMNGAPITARDVAVANAESKNDSSAFHLAVLHSSALRSDDAKLTVYSLEPDGLRVTPLPPAQQLVGIEGRASRLLSADVNGDERNDLIVLGESGELLVFVHDDDGFSGGTSIHVGVGPSDILLVESDIVVTNRHSGDVSWLASNGTRSLTEQLRVRAGTLVYGIGSTDNVGTIVSREEPRSVAAGDFNGDSHTDLVVASGSSRAAILLGKPTGGFVDPQPMVLPSPATQVVSADFDGDDQPEIAFLHPDREQVSVFSSAEILLSDPARTHVLDAGNVPITLSAEDLNGDSVADLLIVDRFGDVLTRRGNGDGTFDKYMRIDHTVTLDVSGSESVVVGHRSLDKLYLSDADIQGLNELNEAVGIELSAPEAVRFVDVNQDGFDDLIVANNGAYSSAQFDGDRQRPDILVYLRGPNGKLHQLQAFKSDNAWESAYARRPNAVDITDRDMDGDGLPDLVVTNFGLDTVSLLINEGNDKASGTWNGFSLESTVDVEPGPIATEVRDVTGDGFLDLIVTSRHARTVQLLPSVGDDTFAFGEGRTVAIPGQPVCSAIGVDRAFVTLADGSVVHFLLDKFNLGGGDVETIEIRPNGETAPIVSAIVPVDVDGDGQSELFLVGSDTEKQPVASWLDQGIFSNEYVEMDRFSPPELRELENLGSIDVTRRDHRTFVIYVAQSVDQDDKLSDSYVSFTVEIVNSLVNAVANVMGHERITNSISLALVGIVQSPALARPEELVPIAIEPADGSDDTTVGLIELMSRQIQGIAEAFHEVWSVTAKSLMDGLRFALGTQRTEVLANGIVEAAREALASSFPGLPLMGSLAAVFRERDDASTSPAMLAPADSDRHETFDADEVLRMAQDRLDQLLQRTAAEAPVEYLISLLPRVQKGLHDSVVPPSADQLAETMLASLEIVRAALEKVKAEVNEPLGQMTASQRNHLRDILSGIFALVGAGGLAWHIVDKHGSRRLMSARLAR